MLEELDEVAATRVTHALTKSLDGIVLVVDVVIHAATRFLDAVMRQQVREPLVVMLVDGLRHIVGLSFDKFS